MTTSKCADEETHCIGCNRMTKSRRIGRARHECVKCAYNKCFGDLLQKESSK